MQRQAQEGSSLRESRTGKPKGGTARMEGEPLGEAKEKAKVPGKSARTNRYT
jgi:hypothetical protein